MPSSLAGSQLVYSTRSICRRLILEAGTGAGTGGWEALSGDVKMCGWLVAAVCGSQTSQARGSELLETEPTWNINVSSCFSSRFSGLWKTPPK